MCVKMKEQFMYYYNTGQRLVVRSSTTKFMVSTVSVANMILTDSLAEKILSDPLLIEKVVSQLWQKLLDRDEIFGENYQGTGENVHERSNPTPSAMCRGNENGEYSI